jgi:hypothetical protein
MRTSFFPWNMLRLVMPPMVLGSKKSGAFSPTSRAAVSRTPTSRQASSIPTSTRSLMPCLRLSTASLLCMIGHCPHTTLATRPAWYHTFAHRHSPVPQRMSRLAWYSTTGAIVSPGAFVTFRLNEQTRTPNAGLERRPTGNSPRIAQKRTLWAVRLQALVRTSLRKEIYSDPFLP